MSFFDDASLAFLPSGGAGKDGKAYSIKPTDGTGDFTFSRGSNLTATRVDSNGLIEKGRENLLLQSNSFDTTWANSNTDETSGQSGYDGSSNAWLLERTAANGFINQSNASSGVLCFSIYLKAGSYDWAFIRVQDSAGYRGVYFDLQNGTTGGVDSGIIDYNIEAIGTNGWYRCSLVLSNTLVRVLIYPSASNGGVFLSGTGNILIQDAQLEIGLVATDYIESGASTGKAGLLENEPRFDYSGGATCPSLLLEPQRGNLIGYSEYYGSNLFVNSSPEINNTTSPEGVQNATLLKEDTNSGNHAMREPLNTSIAADDSQYVISFFAKSNGRNIRFIDDGYAGSGTIVNFNLSSGGTFSNGAAVIDSDAVAIGTDGWYRCYAVIDKASAAQSGFRFSLRLLGGASNDNDSYTGDGTSGVWIYGKEANDAVSYPTSYIPNHSGGSATRTAEKQEVTGLTSSVLNQSEGSFYIELQTLSTDAGRVVITSYPTGASNDTIRFIFTNQINFGLVSAGTLGDSTNPTSAKVKVAGTYSGTELKLCVNGGAVQKSSGNFSFANQPTKIYTHAFVDTIRLFADIDQMLYFPTALSDADMITLTT